MKLEIKKGYKTPFRRSGHKLVLFCWQNSIISWLVVLKSLFSSSYQYIVCMSLSISLLNDCHMNSCLLANSFLLGLRSRWCFPIFHLWLRCVHIWMYLYRSICVHIFVVFTPWCWAQEYWFVKFFLCSCCGHAHT